MPAKTKKSSVVGIANESVSPPENFQFAQLHGTNSSMHSAVAHFDELPDCAYVRLPVVLALFGCRKTTAWRWVKSGRIPAPKKLGGTSIFQVGQLRACLNSVQSSD